MPHLMLYRSRLHGYTPYAWGLRSGPAGWIILWMAHKVKLANPFILFLALNKFSCLILPIIYAYNTGISRLRLYARLWLQDVTLIVYLTPVRRYDSGHISRLQSHFSISVKRNDSSRISWLWLCITAPVNEQATCLTTSAVKDFAWLS
jgi:hypothetical protein